MTRLSDRMDDYCFFDFETRALPGSGSNGDVTVAGTYRYAKNARPIILTYAIGDGPVRCFDLGWTIGLTWDEVLNQVQEICKDGAFIPQDLQDFCDRAADGKAWFVAWNTGFDRAIWNTSLADFTGYDMTPEMALDAMAQAMASNLPGDLQSASVALGGAGKQKDGKDLIKLFSPEDGATPSEKPDEWEQFRNYAVQDVEQLRFAFKSTRPLPRREWEEYWVSERINERGIGVDVRFCEKAHLVHLANIERSNQRLAEITGNPDIRVTTVDQLAQWVHARIDETGRHILDEPQPDDEEGNKVKAKVRFDRARIGKLIAYLKTAHDLPKLDVIEVLELREYGGSSSPVKFDKIVSQHDGERLKGQYTFNGAPQTGRFSSRGVQIHNLPRASLGEREEEAIMMINDPGGPPKLPSLTGIPLDVRTLFETLTLELVNAGWTHYSADAVLHRIRWHFHVEKGDRTFKANNNWTSALARWFMAKHPHLDGFFETRELKAATVYYRGENDDARQ